MNWICNWICISQKDAWGNLEGRNELTRRWWLSKKSRYNEDVILINHIVDGAINISVFNRIKLGEDYN